MSELTNIAALKYLQEYDPAVGNAMNDELKRQRRNLELIASENIVTPAVMAEQQKFMPMVVLLPKTKVPALIYFKNGCRSKCCWKS